MSDWTFVSPCAPSVPESCSPGVNYLDGFFFPPAVLADAANQQRLIWPLLVAAAAGPSTALALATAAYALSDVAGASFAPTPAPADFPPTATPMAALHGAVTLVGPNRVALAQAFADVAVSGRRALAAFSADRPRADGLARAALELLANVPGVTQALVTRGAEQALARADAVSGYLKAVVPDRAVRARLGWIAVAAEIDGPRRPVNISSLPFPQYDITVPVRAPSGAVVQVEARFAVVSEAAAPSPRPQIPPGNTVLLFIHGDGSRLEEVTPLVAPLIAAGRRDGRPYTIVAVDLPSHGCSTMVDPLGPAFAGTPPWDDHAPEPPSRPPSYPVLEFLENFVVAFVAALDAEIHFAHQLVGPMGGSLGGNMSLRLARREEPWIRQSIAWSPASVWDSLADDIVKQAGPNHCSTEGHRPESAATRAAFMFDVFESSTSVGPIPIVLPQGDYWYRDDWQPCKSRILEAGHWERREIYCHEYRQTHYRMDWEQLIYSYNDPDHGSRAPRYESFRSRLLLASGAKDNNSPSTQIYGSCLTLARRLERTATRGRTFFALDTGHSMHDERPELMAAQIDAFTAETLGGGRVPLKAAGNPLVRFTGQVHDWSQPITFAPADADKRVLLLLLTIQTGGDDLRGGSNPGDNVNATLRLSSGGTIGFPNINAGQDWENGSTHTVQLPVPEGTRAGDLAQLSLHTGFRGGIDGDNWNVNGVVVTAILSAAASPGHSPVLRSWLDAAGNPLVRFTGSTHEWTHPVEAAAADAGKALLSLTLIIQTGGDDLRGGSHPGDNCDVVLTRRSAAPLTITNVNGGANWKNGETHQVNLPVPPGTKSGDVTALTLRTQFGGGIGGDNWNVNHVTLQALVAG